MKVLDIGCGTGGSAFYMANKYGVEVLGLDLSQNMLDIANEHKKKLFSEKVQITEDKSYYLFPLRVPVDTTSIATINISFVILDLFVHQVQHNVSFRMLDATTAQFPDNYFDVVYSRDAIMHIAEKKKLYQEVFVSFQLYSPDPMCIPFIIKALCIPFLFQTEMAKTQWATSGFGVCSW